jgi:uncharacterized membrane protein YhaH (DUF805 family)
MNWYIQVLKKYAVFSGRARRKEYWMFFLFNIIFAASASFLDNMIGTTIGDSSFGVLHTLYSLTVIVLGLAVTVRRLHDTDRSGWWIFIVLIPLIGTVWLLILMVDNSTSGENKYGQNPKEAEENKGTLVF